MRMGNQPSHMEGSLHRHRYNTRHSSRSRSLAATRALPYRTVGSVRNESRMNLDVQVKADPWISKTGSVFSGSPSPTEKSTPCPTELPPPRTMDGAGKMLSRLRAVFRKRDLEVKGLVTGLGGECGFSSSLFKNYCDGHLVFELQMTEHELGDLQREMATVAIWRDGAPVVLSQKLLGDVFAVLDGYGKVIEDVVELCGKLRKMQTGERLPEESDVKWVKENITPDAVRFASRLKHLTSRSQVVRFDMDQEISDLVSGL